VGSQIIGGEIAWSSIKKIQYSLVLLYSGRNMVSTRPQMKAYGKVSLDVHKKECNSLTERRGSEEAAHQRRTLDYHNT
jgi:hypothetical protein